MTTGSHQTGDAPLAHTTSASPDSGLSTGAKAGVAIGVIVAVLAVLAGAFFWFLKRRRTRQRLPDGTNKGDQAAYFDGKVELPNDEVRRNHQDPPIELDALDHNQHELDGSDSGMKHYKKPTSPIKLEGS